jgi:hypothetical protein
VGLIGIGGIITFAVFYTISTYFPGLMKLLWISFIACFIVLMINPAAGAALTLCVIGAFGLIGFLLALPLILSYCAGVAFIVLLIIGLGELAK